VAVTPNFENEKMNPILQLSALDRGLPHLFVALVWRGLGVRFSKVRNETNLQLSTAFAAWMACVRRFEFFDMTQLI